MSEVHASKSATSAAPSHDDLVVQQFGSQAAAYVASAVHSAGPDIEQLQRLVPPGARVLDLGCGGGHVSYAAATIAGEVIAYDLSADMLEAVSAEAGRRGLSNIVTRQGAAERLPFEDESFDIVLSRYSAHHWHDVRAGMREARRVLRTGGIAGICDTIAPEEPVLDSFLQTIEMLRDPSHVRDYSSAEWVEIAAEAGLALTGAARRRVPLEFKSWIARMRTPEVQIAAIRAMQAAVSDRVRAHFDVETDGTFTIDVAVFELARL